MSADSMDGYSTYTAVFWRVRKWIRPFEVAREARHVAVCARDDQTFGPYTSDDTILMKTRYDSEQDWAVSQCNDRVFAGERYLPH